MSPLLLLLLLLLLLPLLPLLLLPLLLLPLLLSCIRSCWAAEASERPNIDMVIQCLGLMIDDRQAATP